MERKTRISRSEEGGGGGEAGRWRKRSGKVQENRDEEGDWEGDGMDSLKATLREL